MLSVSRRSQVAKPTHSSTRQYGMPLYQLSALEYAGLGRLPGRQCARSNHPNLHVRQSDSDSSEYSLFNFACCRLWAMITRGASASPAALGTLQKSEPKDSGLPNQHRKPKIGSCLHCKSRRSQQLHSTMAAEGFDMSKAVLLCMV